MSDTTAAGVLNDLAITRKTLDDWECGPITIDVCNSSSNDILKTINFTETIGYQKKHQGPGGEMMIIVIGLTLSGIEMMTILGKISSYPISLLQQATLVAEFKARGSPKNSTSDSHAFVAEKTIPIMPLTITHPRSGPKRN